jgi:hypothetical protein
VPLYEQLHDALARTFDTDSKPESDVAQPFRRSFPLQILFAGRMPKPRWGPAAARISPQDLRVFISEGGLKLRPSDFNRFLGVAWRLVIAHKLRAHWRRECVARFLAAGKSMPVALRERIQRAVSDTARTMADAAYDDLVRRAVAQIYLPVRVVVAAIPVGTTIVDDDVFVQFASSTADLDIRDTRGTLLELPPSIKEETADAYVDLISRYLPQAHSAREYIQSMLFLTNLMAEGNLDRYHIDAHRDARQSYLEWSLFELGLHEWSVDEAKRFEQIRKSTDLDREVMLQRGALEVMREFLAMPTVYDVHSLDTTRGATAMPQYADLRRALA